MATDEPRLRYGLQTSGASVRNGCREAGWRDKRHGWSDAMCLDEGQVGQASHTGVFPSEGEDEVGVVMEFVKQVETSSTRLAHDDLTTPCLLLNVVLGGTSAGALPRLCNGTIHAPQQPSLCTSPTNLSPSRPSLSRSVMASLGFTQTSTSGCGRRAGLRAAPSVGSHASSDASSLNTATWRGAVTPAAVVSCRVRNMSLPETRQCQQCFRPLLQPASPKVPRHTPHNPRNEACSASTKYLHHPLSTTECF